MSARIAIALVALAVVVVVGLMSTFTVDQRVQALVLEFGAPTREIREPGLHFKKPWENVQRFDLRLLDFDADAQEVTMLDQRRMVVDAYARYRIVQPLQFYQTIGTEIQFRQRLQAIMNSSLRNVLGQENFAAVLSPRRGEIMAKVRDQVVAEAQSFGVQIDDVRFMRADLHPDNSQAIFRRMQTEREREAREARAQGGETAQRIRAQAERERTVLIAEAQRQSQILRGQGEAESTKVFADAFGQDPEFYDFWRSLEAQRKALGEGTTMVISPDSDFFRFFRDMQGGAPLSAPRR